MLYLLHLKHYSSLPPRGERRFEKPLRREVGRPGFEETAGPVVPGRKEYTRADSDNWRTLREEQDEDDGESGNNWRLSGPRRDGTRLFYRRWVVFVSAAGYLGNKDDLN